MAGWNECCFKSNLNEGGFLICFEINLRDYLPYKIHPFKKTIFTA
jgi:hypothetical protein